MSTPAIVVKNLTKIFPQRAREDGFLGAIRSLLPSRTAGFVAVDDLSFEISEGEIVGLLGPNGAGKSTAVKMLTGILYPTRGIIRIHGLDPIKDRVINARQIGVVFGQRTQLWWDLPVADSLEMLRRIYDVPNHVFKQKLDLFREVLDLHEFLDVPVRRLSLGQRVRSDIAAALLHNPRVIYLDEPTIGVDLSARERIREFIRSINRESGVTVILTTHEMSDVERLCKRIIVMAVFATTVIWNICGSGSGPFVNSLSIFTSPLTISTYLLVQQSSAPAAPVHGSRSNAISSRHHNSSLISKHRLRWTI